mmetsp:Transcript_51004/g.109248  ORF Transcript_51004/g.109248 Transcript_51004/m.109248 type:complete len:201 (-) Transcript_51004:983-1585(-)
MLAWINIVAIAVGENILDLGAPNVGFWGEVHQCCVGAIDGTEMMPRRITDLRTRPPQIVDPIEPTVVMPLRSEPKKEPRVDEWPLYEQVHEVAPARLDAMVAPHLLASINPSLSRSFIVLMIHLDPGVHGEIRRHEIPAPICGRDYFQVWDLLETIVGLTKKVCASWIWLILAIAIYKRPTLLYQVIDLLSHKCYSVVHL